MLTSILSHAICHSHLVHNVILTTVCYSHSTGKQIINFIRYIALCIIFRRIENHNSKINNYASWPEKEQLMIKWYAIFEKSFFFVIKKMLLEISKICSSRYTRKSKLVQRIQKLRHISFINICNIHMYREILFTSLLSVHTLRKLFRFF